MLIDKIKCIRSLSTKINNISYVTTPIFYVNASPHIGHLYSAVIADAIVRYNRLLYPERDTYFSTGTDEHGLKIQQAADLHKAPVSNYCDTISKNYKNLFNLAGINFNKFIRTSEIEHKNAVSHFWNELKSRDSIYSAQYSGWYCISDETFLTDSQLKDNADGTKVSLESGHQVQWTEEKNYMFKLSAFQQNVLDWIKEGNKIHPLKFENILLNYLSEPLPDVSISRPTERVNWAIPVPDDNNQTIYVWLDALVNYLTCAGYPNPSFKSYWPPKIQVIGKDILKFHGVYWPAFLIAAGLEPPQKLLVHSHWTVDGQKMSKSKFNVVDPLEVSEKYTMEGLRYFLLREGVAHSDGNYSAIKAVRVLNSELADTLGNLLSRCCAKSLNPRQVYPCVYLNHMEALSRLKATEHLIDVLYQLPEISTQHYDAFNFYLVVGQVMTTLRAANNFFESSKPWELKKKAGQEEIPENTLKLETIIGVTLDTLKVCSIILQPIIPNISEKILNKLNVPISERTWRNLNKSFLYRTKENEESLGVENNIVFQRILSSEQKAKIKSA